MDISGNTCENSCQSNQAENREQKKHDVSGVPLSSSPQGCTEMLQWTELYSPPACVNWFKAPVISKGFHMVTNMCVCE
jgi:hypothetical protein